MNKFGEAAQAAGDDAENIDAGVLDVHENEDATLDVDETEKEDATDVDKGTNGDPEQINNPNQDGNELSHRCMSHFVDITNQELQPPNQRAVISKSCLKAKMINTKQHRGSPVEQRLHAAASIQALRASLQAAEQVAPQTPIDLGIHEWPSTAK